MRILKNFFDYLTSNKMGKLERLITSIEKSNAEFELMTPAEKRVVIAKDCIKRIQVGQLDPYRGRFICDGHLNQLKGKEYFHTLKEGEGESASLKEKFNELPTCSACAKGSLLLTYVGRVNSFNTDDLDNTNDNSSTDKSHQKLQELFSLEQLALIEFAFEGKQFIKEDSNGKKIEFDDETYFKTIKYHNRFKNSSNRMLGICKNIIANKGEFIIK